MFKRNIFKILAIVFFLLAGASFYNSNKTITKKLINNKQVVKKIILPTKIPTIILKPTIFVKGSENPTPTNVLPIQPTANSTASTDSTNSTVSQPTNSPQQDIINLEINAPDGNNKFTLIYKDDTNPCSILNDAKNDGKIKSLIITHYGPPLNSDYVKEINGFSDNWNFAIDGNGKPTGCSNYKLNKNSTVTWKYN